MKISIVTPTFNGINTLRETIESVRRQDYTEWEHIVVDGGSTDGTIELLRRYPHLQWASEKDEGHYDAMNKGIARASGEVVAILNADDCYRAGTLKKVAEAFRDHPDWDALFGDIVYVDGAGREIFRREEARYDYAVLRFGSVRYVIHPTLFVKKSVHDRIGTYRHRQYLNCCDADFILRLGQQGCRVGHIPDYLANYRLHEHGQSADRRVSLNMQREYLAIRKEHGLPEGIAGTLLGVFARVKRQLQKLVYRGKLDLVSGKWQLRKHMHDETTFSSNSGVDKL
ncbi:MAG TPA: glycosyltransferase family 2 protein [Candidatus Methylomirabilis sp.]|nr:glycosyltransferase family 2 protein [Candidatus Methylomirabilis sp.]